MAEIIFIIKRSETTASLTWPKGRLCHMGLAPGYLGKAGKFKNFASGLGFPGTGTGSDW